MISALGKRLAPSVARLPHANSRLPATWTYYPSRLASRLYRPKTSRASNSSKGPVWVTEGSFVHYAKFFGNAPAWQEIRKGLLGRAESVLILSEIIDVDIHKTFGCFSDTYDSLLDAAILQSIRLIDGVARERTSGARE